MDIQHEESENRGKFFININGERKALMTYSRTGRHKIIIDHTEVDEELQGQGVGHKLVEAAVNYARKNDIKILPLCPFAKAIVDKNSDYEDIRF